MPKKYVHAPVYALLFPFVAKILAIWIKVNQTIDNFAISIIALKKITTCTWYYDENFKENAFYAKNAGFKIDIKVLYFGSFFSNAVLILFFFHWAVSSDQHAYSQSYKQSPANKQWRFVKIMLKKHVTIKFQENLYSPGNTENYIKLIKIR